MKQVQRLLEVMRALRHPETGCPWDRAQSFASVAPYTIEEAYEVADAIARGDLSDLREELGDLLFQVVFHAQMAAERGEFDFDSVAGAVVDKMVRRHPHVFADARVHGIEAQSVSWEQIKSEERAGKGRPTGSLMDDVPRGLPALHRAHELQSRAARVGFDWGSAGAVLPKLEEELEELREALGEGPRADEVRAELGDLLFTCVNLARHLGVDPDRALREATLEFEDRFREMEARASRRGTPVQGLEPDVLESLWDEAKRARG